MPDVKLAGICSRWTIACNTFKSHFCRTDPPNFRCSGERLSRPPAFPLFSRFKACTISSGVSGSSKSRFLLLKVSVRCTLHFFGLLCLFEVARSWKCWAQIGRISSSLWPCTSSHIGLRNDVDDLLVLVRAAAMYGWADGQMYLTHVPLHCTWLACFLLFGSGCYSQLLTLSSHFQSGPVASTPCDATKRRFWSSRILSSKPWTFGSPCSFSPPRVPKWAMKSP